LITNSLLYTEERRQINISWQELFPDHLERVCVFVEGTTVFRFTSQYEKMVHLNVGSIEEELKKYGYKIEDIDIVIHNHFTKCEFSDSDETQYRMLKKRGFNGLFLLYCYRTGETYDIEKRGESK